MPSVRTPAATVQFPPPNPPRSDNRSVRARSRSEERTFIGPTRPRSLLEANAVSHAASAVAEAKSATRRSSLLTRRSTVSEPAAPSLLMNGKSLRASCHAAPARMRAPPSASVAAPSTVRVPKAPLLTANTGASLLVSAIVPPMAPPPAAPSAPGTTRTLPIAASGRSAASAMPVAGSLSGTPSSVTSTCSARAPRSCHVASPRAERLPTPGIDATSAARLGCAISRADSTLRVTLLRPGGSAAPVVWTTGSRRIGGESQASIVSRIVATNTARA